MRIGFSERTRSLRATVLLSLVLILGAVAKDKTPNMTAVQGKVFLIDRDNSTIMVDAKSGGRRLVAYTADTKFIHGRNDKGRETSLDQIKETDYVSCIGTLDDRERLVAKECLSRELR